VKVIVVQTSVSNFTAEMEDLKLMLHL